MTKALTRNATYADLYRLAFSPASYGRSLLVALLCAQVPLLAAVVLPLIGNVTLLAWLGNPLSFRLVYVSALLILQPYAYALLTVLLFGAPVYALLAQRGCVNWLTAAVLGIAPGVGALLIGIYPSGRLVDANVTIGPIVMACGLYVALGTHAIAREVAFTPDHAVRQVLRRSALPLARVFVLAAILAFAWGLKIARPGVDFAALGFLAAAGLYIIPFLLGAVATALYSYFAAPKPRGIARVLEILVYTAIGAVLLYPAALLLMSVLRL